MRNLGLSIATAALVAFGAGAASQDAAAASAAVPPQQDYSFTGLFGSFDRGELQRGLQVYVNACSSCHSLDLIRFRELEALGYTEDQIKAFAAEFDIEDGPNEDGDMEDRPGKPADAFPSPFPNVQAAAATHGKAPPDLSLIVKARAHGLGSIGKNFLDMLRGGEFASGSSYVAALVGDGYRENPTLEDKLACQPISVPSVPKKTDDPEWNDAIVKVSGQPIPADISDEDWFAILEPIEEEVQQEVYIAQLTAWEPAEGTHFNKWFPGCSIAMVNPLYEDAVEYTDGTPATPEQMARDVSVFLTWASEPSLEDRKQTGIGVLLFLIVFTGILIAVKRQVWAGVKH